MTNLSDVKLDILMGMFVKFQNLFKLQQSKTTHEMAEMKIELGSICSPPSFSHHDQTTSQNHQANNRRTSMFLGGYFSELFVFGSCSKLQSGCKFDHSPAGLERCTTSFTLLGKRQLLQHNALPQPPIRSSPLLHHQNPNNMNHIDDVSKAVNAITASVATSANLDFQTLALQKQEYHDRKMSICASSFTTLDSLALQDRSSVQVLFHPTQGTVYADNSIEQRYDLLTSILVTPNAGQTIPPWLRPIDAIAPEESATPG